jgi:predicted ATPase with chaperone activity
VYLHHVHGQPLPAGPVPGPPDLRPLAGPRRSSIGQHPHRSTPRVEAARERQRARFEGSSGLLSNADMGPAEVREHCRVDDTGRSLLRAAMQQLKMSTQAYNELSGVRGILKLSRTIAHLAGAIGQAQA